MNKIKTLFLGILIAVNLSSFSQLLVPETEVIEVAGLHDSLNFQFVQNKQLFSEGWHKLEQPNFWRQIKYPKLKASIEVTYRPIENNLLELLTESEKLVYKHAVKAEEIITKNFENFDNKVFGSMQEISGNAASQIQFHVTDSTHNFIRGALYFYAKPNYDSILPAVDYIKKDILRLIETLEWN